MTGPKPVALPLGYAPIIGMKFNDVISHAQTLRQFKILIPRTFMQLEVPRHSLQLFCILQSHDLQSAAVFQN